MSSPTSSTSSSPTEIVRTILSAASCPACVLIIAPDEVRKLRISKMLQEKFLKNAASDAVLRLRGSELNRDSLRKLRDESAAPSLFSPTRFMVVDQVEEAGADGQRELAKIVESVRAANSGVSLILRAGSLPTSSILYKACALAGTVVALPELKGAELIKWTAKELQQNGLQKAPEAVVNTLAEIGSESPDEIAKLCEHLALYLDGPTVTVEDLYAVFVSKVSADEFKLLELVTQGRSGQAEVLLSSLMRKGTSPFSLMGLLARNFHTYLSVQYLQEKRMSSGEIGQALNLQSWLLNKHLSAVRRYQLPSLKHGIESILRADSKLKNRSVGADAVLGELITRLAPPTRPAAP